MTLLFYYGCSLQIFYGLHRILGKKFSVGTEHLTWTLLKYMGSDFSKQDASDDEGLVESYSKLNVALHVMHECFEPVEEPRTKRDLMEDVIFNRWYANLVFQLLLVHRFKASIIFMGMQIVEYFLTCCVFWCLLFLFSNLTSSKYDII